MPDKKTTQSLSPRLRLARPGDEPGLARIRRFAQNPAGQVDALFVIDGDFVSGAPKVVVAEDEGDLPVAKPGARRLRLFHVNDMHNHICDIAGNGTVAHRLGEMVAKVTMARAAAGPDEAVLFLSAGDDHTGTVLDELVGWSRDEFTLDPGYRALSAAGLDVATIGNHEFDRGAAQLVLGQGEAAFPLLSANVHSSAHMKPGEHYHAAALAEVKGLRVGIIGLTTRVETRVGQPGDPDMAVASPVEVLTNILPLIDSVADVVVVLSHCGFGDGSHVSGKAAVARDIGEADFALADVTGRLCTKPAVIVGAHTHTRLNEHGVEADNIRSGVLITQAECNGRYLGEITMDLSGEAKIDARLHPISGEGVADTPFVTTHMAPILEQATRRMGDMIGTAEGGALSWAKTRTERYCSETALANFMNDAMVAQLSDQPDVAVDLAIMNGGSILAGVEPGPITFGDFFDVMPYSDEVFIMHATGRQIREILMSNAQRLLRPEEVAVTNTGGFVARGFLHCSADLRYRIALGSSALEARAEDITLFGRPIEEQFERSFTIATTTYLALGSFGERWNGSTLSGGIAGDVPGYDLRVLDRRNTGLVYRNVLIERIRALGTISGALDGRLVLSG